VLVRGTGWSLKSGDQILREFLRELYFGTTQRAYAFRYGMLLFDLLIISFLVISSFTKHEASETIDTLVGIIIGLDFLARLWAENFRKQFLLKPTTWADIAVVISLIAPLVGEGLAFLRVFRIVRLLRSEWVLDHWRKHSATFRRNEKSIHAGANLVVFLFLMTGIVYETQSGINPKINNYLDALYFATTTLSTTGYGDITLEGPWGRLLSIFMMVAGISLFLRMVQVFLRPSKVDHSCPQCGLTRHESDAVHCKACGIVLNIRDEGLD
jgi:voltage-gated potassium channel